MGVRVEIDKPSQDDTGCDGNPSMAAARAEAVQFQSMGLDDKPILRCDLLLQPFDLAILELHNGTAPRADEMIVMTFVGDVVVLRLGAEVSGLGNAGFAKQVQRTVDGGEAEMRILLRELMVHGFGRDVFLPEECRQDQLALAGQL